LELSFVLLFDHLIQKKIYSLYLYLYYKKNIYLIKVRIHILFITYQSIKTIYRCKNWDTEKTHTYSGDDKINWCVYGENVRIKLKNVEEEVSFLLLIITF